MNRAVFDDPIKARKALRLLREGKSKSHIAFVIGCSEIPVKRFAWKHGFARKQNVKVFDSSKKIREVKRMYYEDGLRYEDIAVHFSCTKGTVKNLFREQGWIPRGNTGDDNPSRRKALKNIAHIRSTPGGVSLTLADYRGSVGYLTQLVYKLYMDDIEGPPYTKGMHLDHLYCVSESFYNPKKLKKRVTLKELCHPVNLRIVSQRENNMKKDKSCISATELRRRIRRYNEEHGDPFAHAKFSKFKFKEWKGGVIKRSPSGDVRHYF